MKKMVLIYFCILFLTGVQNYLSFAVLNSFISIFTVLIIIFSHHDKNWLENVVYPRQGYLKALASLVFSIFMVLIFHFLWNNLPFTSAYGVLKFQLKEWDILILLTLNLLLSCFIEEIVFRGYFQEEVKRLSSHIPATLSIFYQILIPALLFSLMHVFKMGPNCLIILIPGFLFGILKYYSGNIYASVGSHLVFNVYYGLLLSPPF